MFFIAYFSEIYTNKVIIVRTITARITPLAINSLFDFSKAQKTIKSNTVPKVIILPNLPSACNNSIPIINEYLVNRRMKRKQPKREVNIPIMNPISRSVLFFKGYSN
jgi:hypothetical protein